jgi:hypothetical protein
VTAEGKTVEHGPSSSTQPSARVPTLREFAPRWIEGHAEALGQKRSVTRPFVWPFNECDVVTLRQDAVTPTLLCPIPPLAHTGLLAFILPSASLRGWRNHVDHRGHECQRQSGRQ